MKRVIFPIIAGIALFSVGADNPKKLWERDWNRKSFCTTVSMLALQAGEDGKVSDEELIVIAKAGFRLLEPEEKTAKLVTDIRSEGDSRVVFNAYDNGTTFLGYAFSLSENGHFEKLVIIPSE